MSYIVKYCTECGREYHIHQNGKIAGACDHIKLSTTKGRHTFRGILADSKELDKMLADW